MYTFGARLTEPRASLLANKGFVVLALAYMGYEDLPKGPKKLDLEYFEEAVTYLRKHPEVSVKDNHICNIRISILSFPKRCYVLIVKNVSNELIT